MKGMTDTPDVLDNVERIDAADGGDSVRQLLRARMPAIVRNSQQGARISSVLDEAAAAAVFGDVPIEVQHNYTSALSADPAAAQRGGLSRKIRNDIGQMRLADYLAQVRDDPDTDLLCVEYPTPAAVLAAMTIPGAPPWPTTEPLVTFTFVANHGNYAHLHFDGDFRSVLLYQVFGRKRVVMVPLVAQDKVVPSMNFSKLLVQNMDAGEKLDLFRYLGAYDCVLQSGEAVLFPPSIWHYVEYLDTGMSVNFRFGREDFVRTLVDANRVPFYPELHLLLERVHGVRDPVERAGLEEGIWTETSALLGQDFPTSRDRHRAVQALYRSLLARLPGPTRRPTQVLIDCPVAEEMAVERYDSTATRWRKELMLGAPL